MNNLYGNWIFGTHNCDAEKVIPKNGIMSGAILSGKDWSQNQRIGLMLAKYMFWRSMRAKW